MAHNRSGHLTVPHTADLRIEAWAPNRDGCIRQAMLSTVESLLDTSSAHPQRTCRRRLTGDKPRRPARRRARGSHLLTGHRRRGAG
ncbi:MAG: archease [Mycobacterium sp.]|nr:archease [Mycobacterium sp.]